MRWEILVCETGMVLTFPTQAEAQARQAALARLGCHGIIGRRDDLPVEPLLATAGKNDHQPAR